MVGQTEGMTNKKAPGDYPEALICLSQLITAWVQSSACCGRGTLRSLP